MINTIICSQRREANRLGFHPYKAEETINAINNIVSALKVACYYYLVRNLDVWFLRSNAKCTLYIVKMIKMTLIIGNEMFNALILY